MKWFEWLNLAVFGSIGSAEIVFGLIGRTDGFGFYHPPLTEIIAGLGLILLVGKWKLYGFPLFVMAVQIPEDPWAQSSFTSIGAAQIILLLFGYAMTLPSFKNPAWIPVVAMINVLRWDPYISFIDWHHICEMSVFALLLFDIKKVDNPLSWVLRRAKGRGDYASVQMT